MSKSLATKVEADDSKDDLASKKASQLPVPRGYKILIALPERVEKTEGGIIKSARSLQEDEVGSIVGMVLELGADAYSDPQRFPSGLGVLKVIGSLCVLTQVLELRYMGKSFV